MNNFTDNHLIYKYCPLNDKTIDTLMHNRLFFSKPSAVNDVFDCKFKLKVNSNIEGVENFYKGLNISEEEKQRKIELFRTDKNEFHKDIEAEYNFKLRTENGLTCFSEKNDILLMWANYADKHKGICLIFDWMVHKEYFKGYKVQYGKELPEVYYDGNGVFEIGKIILNKLDHWAYECEVRSFAKLDDGDNQLVKFNPLALKGIIFGERTSNAKRKVVRNIIKMNPYYTNVEFFNQTTEGTKAKIEKIN